MSDGQKVTWSLCFFPLLAGLAIYSSLPKPMPLQNQPDTSCSFGQVMYSLWRIQVTYFFPDFAIVYPKSSFLWDKW